MRNSLIKLFEGDFRRITISHSCKEISYLQGKKCKHHTIVPQGPWSALTSSELSNIIQHGDMQLQDVALIKIPRRVVKLLKKTKLHEFINYRDLEYFEESEIFNEIKNDLYKFVESFNKFDTEIATHKIFFGKPNLDHTTYHNIEDAYIGLHLDSWEKDDLFQRHNSRNRICINLGANSRFLMFHSVNIQQMAIELNLKDNEEKIDLNEIHKEYISKFPHTPTFRLEIKPFEAYIAPTELLIHDGSSINSKTFDINIVFRGKFIFEKQKSFFNFVTKYFTTKNYTK